MRPRRISVTTVGSKIFPVNFRGGPSSIVATPGAASNYTVEYATTDIQNSDFTPNWEGVTDMVGASTQETRELGSITALRVTLNGGASVDVDFSQSDT